MSPQSGTPVPKQSPSPPVEAKIADDTGGGKPEKVKGTPATKQGDPFAKITVHDLAARNGTPFCKECAEAERLNKKEAEATPAAPKPEPAKAVTPPYMPPEFKPPPKSSASNEEEERKEQENEEQAKDKSKEKEKSAVEKNFSPPAKTSPSGPRSSKPPEL